MLFRLYTGLNINKEKVDKITLNRDFTDIIKATLKQYRKAQMKLLRVAFLAIFVMIFIPVGLYHGNEILQKHPEAMIAISAPFVLGGFYAIFGLAISYWTDYEDFFKANLISNIIKDIDKNFTYVPKKIRDLDEAFGECSFFDRYDYLDKEDYISGAYNGILFDFAEFHFYSKSENFEGCVLSVKLEKKLDFELKLINKKLNFFKKLFSKFDNVDFNKIFAVKGGDMAQNMRILTPSFMEKLVMLNANKEFGHISAVFKDNKFYIYMENNKNLFEPYFFAKPTITFAKYYKYEILKILSLIDELGFAKKINL